MAFVASSDGGGSTRQAAQGCPAGVPSSELKLGVEAAPLGDFGPRREEAEYEQRCLLTFADRTHWASAPEELQATKNGT